MLNIMTDWAQEIVKSYDDIIAVLCKGPSFFQLRLKHVFFFVFNHEDCKDYSSDYVLRDYTDPVNMRGSEMR